MRRWIIGAAVVVVLAIAYSFRPTAIAVDTETVTRGPLEETLDHEGRTRVRDRYVVHAPLGGTLRRIDLEAGDPISAGETALLTIDPPPARLLDPRSEAEASARIDAATAAVSEAREAVEQTETLRGLADREYQRLRDLARAGDAPVSARDLAEQSLRRAEGDARRAIAMKEIADHELAVARAAFARTFGADAEGTPAERALVIRAPVDGSVLRVVRESAGPVAAGEPLLELGDVTDLEIVADYLTTDAVRMRPGMSARIHGWGGPEMRATVRRVEPSGVTKLSALGVEEQRVDVVLDLDEAPDLAGLADGFRVEVRVIAWNSDTALRVPEGALFRIDDGWGVFRYDEGAAVRTAVRIGHRDGRSAEVLEGLREGETVLVHPPDAVEDGARVRARE